MFRTSPRRGQRSKGLKVKHCVQLCILVGVGIWLLYQVRHSHEKKSALAQNTDIPNEVVKFGRKDLNDWTRNTPVKDVRHKEEEEEENETNKNDEERTEFVENVQKEETGANEEEESKDGGTPVLEEGNNDDSRDDERETTENEETNNEEDESDGKNKTHGEENLREEENLDKESESMSEDKKIKEVTDDSEDSENKEEAEENDSSNKEAREQHYKGDDASSEVVHDVPNQPVDRETFSDNEHIETNEKVELELGSKANGTDVRFHQDESGPKTQDVEIIRSNITTNVTNTESSGEMDVLNSDTMSNENLGPSNKTESDEHEIHNESESKDDDSASNAVILQKGFPDSNGSNETRGVDEFNEESFDSSAGKESESQKQSSKNLTETVEVSLSVNNTEEMDNLKLQSNAGANGFQGYNVSTKENRTEPSKDQQNVSTNYVENNVTALDGGNQVWVQKEGHHPSDSSSKVSIGMAGNETREGGDKEVKPSDRSEGEKETVSLSIPREEEKKESEGVRLNRSDEGRTEEGKPDDKVGSTTSNSSVDGGGKEARDSISSSQEPEKAKEEEKKSSTETGQNETGYSEDRNVISNGAADGEHKEGNEDEGGSNHDQINLSNDSSITQEVKDVRTDLETLPETGNVGSDNHVAEE